MASDFIMRLVQKKLLDKNYQVTQEEVFQATDSLGDRIHLAQLLLNMLLDEQKILNKFIEERRKYDGFEEQNNSSNSCVQ